MNPATPTRERLLAAAQELFLERGFQGSGIRAIAARAGCNVSLIRYYFGSKEGLLRAMYQTNIGLVREQIGGLMASDVGPEERIRKLLHFLLRMFDTHQAMIRITFREVLVTGGPMLDEVSLLAQGNRDLFAQFLEQLRLEGRLAPGIDPQLAGPVMLGMVLFYYLAYPLTSRVMGVRTDELVDKLEALIATICLEGLIRPAASAVPASAAAGGEP